MTLMGLILDILLIVMLGVMIFFVMRLHNRLEVLRSGKSDLEGLLQNLISSTATAERSLLEMRGTAADLSATLQRQITGAGSARDELEFLLTSADKMADTLVNHISAARTMTNTGGDTKPAASERRPLVEQPAAMPTSAPTAPTLSVPPQAAPANTSTASRETAERDLLRAIEKLR